MIRLDMWYGRDSSASLRADAIVATPTGSSGYSISLAARLFIRSWMLLPDAHLASAPCVSPDGAGLWRTRCVFMFWKPCPEVYLTQDGQTGVALSPGDTILVSKAAKRLHLVRPVHSHYAHKLKSKGFIRES